jgi:hypothetical protein
MRTASATDMRLGNGTLLNIRGPFGVSMAHCSVYGISNQCHEIRETVKRTSPVLMARQTSRAQGALLEESIQGRGKGIC